MNIPLNIDWQQILLHLLNFAILAGGLYLLLYQPVKKFMAERTAHYEKQEEDANAKLKQAEALEAEYRERLQKAEDEIAGKKAQSLREWEKVGAQMQQEAKQQAQQIVSDARQTAQQEREKILDGAQKEIAGLVTAAAEKLLLKSTASEAFDQFLTAAERGERHE